MMIEMCQGQDLGLALLNHRLDRFEEICQLSHLMREVGYLGIDIFYVVDEVIQPDSDLSKQLALEVHLASYPSSPAR